MLIRYYCRLTILTILLIVGVEGVWVQLLGVEGARGIVILVLRECIWNAPAGLLDSSAFEGYLLHGFFSALGGPLGTTLVDCLPCPCGE